MEPETPKVEPTQEELDEFRRDHIVLKKEEVMTTIEESFRQAIDRLKTRSSYDQTIMGTFLTSMEIELTKDIKQLTEFKR